MYAELRVVHVYNDHRVNYHSDLGCFPYDEDSPHFPPFEDVLQKINTLEVGQKKYVMRSKLSHCSYTCSVLRTA